MGKVKFMNNNKVIRDYTNLFENRTKRLVICSFLAGITSLLQSAGGIGGLGYILSAFASLPIILAGILSCRDGLITYITTLVLLFILQPTELIIFPFTTGILGLALGLAFKYLRSSLAIVCVGGISLCLGIIILLYGFDFPVLGPGFSNFFQLKTAGLLFIFSISYSWIWMKISMFTVKIILSIVLKLK